MNKFKVGDKVIVYNLRNDNDLHVYVPFIGMTGIVLDETDIPHVKLENGENELFYEDELVLESVYNTPLFKIMRENEP